MFSKAPTFKGLGNPLKGAEKHAAVGAKTSVGVKKPDPIGEFKIGRKSESAKVKQIFG